MRILLTGGTGFIGKSLIPILEGKGHELLCISRRKVDPGSVEMIKGDLKNSESYRKKMIDFNPDKIVHMAWEGLPDYSEEKCKINYQASINLFKAASETNCKEIICTGTCWEYAEDQGLIDETGKLDTSNPFKYYKNKTRSEGRQLIKEFAQLTWVRPFFIYGEGQRKESLIPMCVRQLRKNEAPQIKNPDAVNDFVHISDVARGIDTIINNNENSEIYNIGSGRGTAVWEVVNLIANKLGKEIQFRNRPRKCRGNIAENTKLKSKGWELNYNLNKGIEELINKLELGDI